MEKTKFVYLVSVSYQVTKFASIDFSHFVIGIFEEKEDAVRYAMANADSDLREDDVLEALDGEGTVEIWWHPMKIKEDYARRIYVTITEHVLHQKVKKEET